mgnify:CR=1 FL=1
MAAGVNCVHILGNLGSDAEVKYTPQGVAVATMSIATSESWTGKDGQKQEKTEWHRLVCWRKLAEVAGQYCKKGDRIYVQGKLQTRSWDDAEGKKHYMTEIVVNDLKFLGGAGGGQGGEGDLQGGEPARAGAEVGGGGAALDDDSELPF